MWWTKKPSVILTVKADKDAMMDNTIAKCILIAHKLKCKVQVEIGVSPHNRTMIVSGNDDLIKVMNIYADSIGMM